MFEQHILVADQEAELSAELHSLDSAFRPMAVVPVAPSNIGFQLPSRVWTAMLACYAVFFAAIFMATGGSGSARFAIVVSVLYTALYFGISRIAAKQAGPEEPSPLDRGLPLETSTGLMDANSVYGQVLIVPLAIALMGVCMLVIVAFVG